MVFCCRRVLIVLFCIGLLAIQLDRARASRNSHLVINTRNERILTQVSTERMNREKKSAPAQEKFDPNQSSKRKVRKGPDPIHNKSSHDNFMHTKDGSLTAKFCYNEMYSNVVLQRAGVIFVL
ncbi:hypothetical protein ACFE04_024722 [Oxalis oulophora]